MGIFDVFVAFVQGIVEGITEWLPISSTGHMILVDQFLKFSNSEFKDMFLVVVQFGAILAVVILFWKKIFPFDFSGKGESFIKPEIFTLWFKILVACVPAAVIGLLFEEQIDEIFYKPWVVAIALIVYGVLFIVVEEWNKGRKPSITGIGQITYQAALIIGVFQLAAAVVPGTSRSGATILGALMIGISRGVAAEFTFFLAIPVMFGASLLKLVKFAMEGGSFGGWEVASLSVGMLVAFIVSMFVIKFLMGYIRKHDFKVFGYYRIVLGIIVLLYGAFVGFVL
mgnify:CR=1 FL=1